MEFQEFFVKEAMEASKGCGCSKPCDCAKVAKKEKEDGPELEKGEEEEKTASVRLSPGFEKVAVGNAVRSAGKLVSKGMGNNPFSSGASMKSNPFKAAVRGTKKPLPPTRAPKGVPAKRHAPEGFIARARYISRTQKANL